MSNFWMFCPIILLIHHLSKIWMILFWSTVHGWKLCTNIWKAPSGGRAEIQNPKVHNFFFYIFNFSSGTRGHFSNITAPFSSMGCWPKRIIQIFERWCINRSMKQNVQNVLIFGSSLASILKGTWDSRFNLQSAVNNAICYNNLTWQCYILLME